ncbi:MAG: sulfite exporter TauE/SafE family protein [Anaerolineae bacterium]|nr:sulfite exporter TauE/SafE family protein [Anaerolineae bacterium]
MTGKRRARLLAPFLVLLALLATAGVAAAHPLGNFTISRYSAVTLGAETADVLYIVDMAEIPTFQARQAMDSDADGTISAAEEAAYLAAEVPALAANLRLTAGGVALPLTPVAHTLTFPPGQGDLPTLRLEVQLSAALPAGDAALDIAYEDGNFADRIGWREIVINAGSGALLSASVPAADVSHQLRDYPADLLQAPLAVSRATARFAPAGATLDTGATTADPATAAAANSAVVATRFGQDKFADLLQRTLDTPAALAAALLVAVGLGAAHALTPGHGKTIVGAYLVGSRGTARHALFLGVTTTITHTAGVFALGFLVLFASRFVLPEKLYPWLGVLSGLLVAGIGLSILRGHVGHWLAHRRGETHDHGPYHFHFGKGHSHGPDGHTHGDHAHDAHSHEHDTHSAVEAPVVAAVVPRPALAFAGVVSAAPSTVVAHTHGDHAHGDHAHNHDHSHAGHDHHHEHEHRAHGDHTHTPAAAPAEALKWRNLLALGISGGLLPCPSALILMLSAIALRQVGVGLVLILAFSIGLAGVLTGIGLIMVYAGRFLERLPVRHGTLTTRLLPMASAAFITVAGLAITIKALVEAGVI